MRGSVRGVNKNKTPEMIKKELQSSILKVFEEENYLQIEEEVKNAKDLKDGIALVKKYEELLKEANKKINIVGKQGEILKKLKEEHDFLTTLV